MLPFYPLSILFFVLFFLSEPVTFLSVYAIYNIPLMRLNTQNNLQIF